MIRAGGRAGGFVRGGRQGGAGWAGGSASPTPLDCCAIDGAGEGGGGGKKTSTAATVGVAP